MATPSAPNDPDMMYALETLEGTPSRVARFLYAVGTSLSIRIILNRHGYDRSTHDEGWQLLRASCVDPSVTWPTEVDESAQDALIEVDAWDERGFAIVSATLWHHFPAQARFLLSGIGPAQGFAAARGVSELLDRLDKLERGATDSPEDDKRAMAALSKRGLGKAERERLRNLVELASVVQPAPPSLIGYPTGPDARVERLLALRAWYDEWSEIARATVSREDHLVRLGLAKSRRRPPPPTKKKSKPG